MTLLLQHDRAGTAAQSSSRVKLAAPAIAVQVLSPAAAVNFRGIELRIYKLYNIIDMIIFRLSALYRGSSRILLYYDFQEGNFLYEDNRFEQRSGRKLRRL